MAERSFRDVSRRALGLNGNSRVGQLEARVAELESELEPEYGPRRSPPAQPPGLLVLWRRKTVVLSLMVLIASLFGGIYFLLPERFESTVRLEARSSAGNQSSFEFLQASQILARSYSEIARSRVIGERATKLVPFNRTASEVLSSVSVVTVSDTPLIKITAEQKTGREARALANAYSQALLYYVDRRSPPEEGTLTLVHRGESPTRVGPGLALMVAMGLALGLLLGVALAFLTERLERARATPRNPAT